MRFRSLFIGLTAILGIIYVADRFAVKNEPAANAAEEIRRVAVVQPDIVVISSNCGTMDLYYMPPAMQGAQPAPKNIATLKSSVRNSDGTETWRFGIPTKAFEAERIYAACRTTSGTMLSRDMEFSGPKTLKNMLWPAYPSNARL